MSRPVIDLESLRTARCEEPDCDCGQHTGEPLDIACTCSRAPVWLKYFGGDRIVAVCAACGTEIGDIIVGERARATT